MASGTVTLTFSLYEFPEGGAPLWIETQTVQADDQGHYTASLGASSHQGLPPDVLTNGASRWLQVAADLPGVGEQPRVLLARLTKSAVPDGTSSKPSKGTASDGDPACTSIGGSSSQYFVPLWTSNSSSCVLGSSLIFDDTVNNRIGIGTSTPGFTLHVSGSNSSTGGIQVRVSNTATTGNGIAFFAADSGNPPAATAILAADNLGLGPLGTPSGYFGTFTNHPAGIVTNDQARMFFDTSGNVGIGTTTPAATLEVNGTAKLDASVTVKGPSPRIDVTAYGAVADCSGVGCGSTAHDNTSAFQAAFDAAVSNGGKVYIPCTASGKSYYIKGTGGHGIQEFATGFLGLTIETESNTLNSGGTNQPCGMISSDLAGVDIIEVGGIVAPYTSNGLTVKGLSCTDVSSGSPSQNAVHSCLRLDNVQNFDLYDVHWQNLRAVPVPTGAGKI